VWLIVGRMVTRKRIETGVVEKEGEVIECDGEGGRDNEG